MDWKLAIKLGGPSVIAAWLFYSLVTHYLDRSEVFKDNVYLNVLLIVLIFTFCLCMGWLWIKRGRSPDTPQTKVEENEVVNNDVGADMTIGTTSSEVNKNKIKGNKVKGNLKIG